MPLCTVTRRVHFNAAHRLHNPAECDAWNRATFGPCNNPNYHGHNYELEVKVTGFIDTETGFVMDTKKLSDVIKTEIVERFDRRRVGSAERTRRRRLQRGLLARRQAAIFGQPRRIGAVLERRWPIFRGDDRRA